jgi:hypothetical protein
MDCWVCLVSARFFGKRPEDVYFNFRDVHIRNQRLGEDLGMVVGDGETAPTHHHKECSGDLVGAVVQTVEGYAVGGTARETPETLPTVLMAVLDGLSDVTGGIIFVGYSCDNIRIP